MAGTGPVVHINLEDVARIERSDYDSTNTLLLTLAIATALLIGAIALGRSAGHSIGDGIGDALTK